MTDPTLKAQLIEERDALRSRLNGAAEEPSVSRGAVAEALAAARVELVERIERGIPEREFVPGCEADLTGGSGTSCRRLPASARASSRSQYR